MGMVAFYRPAQPQIAPSHGPLTRAAPWQMLGAGFQPVTAAAAPMAAPAVGQPTEENLVEYYKRAPGERADARARDLASAFGVRGDVGGNLAGASARSMYTADVLKLASAQHVFVAEMEAVPSP